MSVYTDVSSSDYPVYFIGSIDIRCHRVELSPHLHIINDASIRIRILNGCNDDLNAAFKHGVRQLKVIFLPDFRSESKIHLVNSPPRIIFISGLAGIFLCTNLLVISKTTASLIGILSAMIQILPEAQGGLQGQAMKANKKSLPINLLVPWLDMTTLLLGDYLVMWRAWALFPETKVVKFTLVPDADKYWLFLGDYIFLNPGFTCLVNVISYIYSITVTNNTSILKIWYSIAVLILVNLGKASTTEISGALSRS
ncbi:hypothetical protein D9757_009699 [Collybiopsis confluens]|uniref:Uncharacterized protein n=1 Tax=Collybiopsis confluens TaxID=2823264 RepID=A0A8H5H6B8_9AGAR|nr:hypothetical protein D9757_009699 [Collybiopsis confluens]